MSLDLRNCKIEGSNKYRLSLPFHATNTLLPLLSADRDIGSFLTPILSSPLSFNGTRIYAATKYYTPSEIVEAFRNATGTEVEFQSISDDEYWNGQMGGTADAISSFSEFARGYDIMGVGAREELEKWIEVSFVFFSQSLVYSEKAL